MGAACRAMRRVRRTEVAYPIPDAHDGQFVAGSCLRHHPCTHGIEVLKDQEPRNLSDD